MSSCPDQTISNRFHLHHLLVFALVWSSLCVICFSHFFFNFFEFHKRCVVGTPKLFLFPTNLLVVARCRPRPSSHASIMPSLGPASARQPLALPLRAPCSARTSSGLRVHWAAAHEHCAFIITIAYLIVYSFIQRPPLKLEYTACAPLEPARAHATSTTNTKCRTPPFFSRMGQLAFHQTMNPIP